MNYYYDVLPSLEHKLTYLLKLTPLPFISWLVGVVLVFLQVKMSKFAENVSFKRTESQEEIQTT